ncbi:NADH-quinone oxidoreductase subunit J [bacterium]|nr:NADH-quinone oxidoreductase subunit J [bacterium]
MPEIHLPSIDQVIFAGLALFTMVSAVLVVASPNLFHNALALVATLFGVAGLYVMLEAEFIAVSQVLVYVGAISTLITFAIMLTRGMMYGKTSPMNRQWGKSALFAFLFFAALLGFVQTTPWSNEAPQLFAAAGSAVTSAGEFITADGLFVSPEAMIAELGVQFVTTYVVAFEVLGLLLLLALVGAVMLARDR